MNDSEKAALRQIQDETFRLRVELDHERRCIDDAVRTLRGATDAILRPKATDVEKVDALARIVDAAIKSLNEPVPE